MRILVVSSHYPNIIGGVSDYTYQLCNELSSKNIEIKVLTSDDSQIVNNESYEVLPYVKTWDICGVKKIISQINNINPDIVLVQYVPTMYSKHGIPCYLCLVYLILHLKKIRIITTFHEVAHKLEFLNIKYLFISVLQRVIAYTLSLLSEKIIVSIERYRKMLFLFNKKIVRIPVGSNIVPVKLSKNEQKLLRKEFASDNEFVIATFGSSSRRIDILVKSISILIERGLKIKFLIIGKLTPDFTLKLNDLINNLEIQDYVILKGYLESIDVYKYLYVSNLYVMIEGIDEYGFTGVNTKSTALAAGYAARLPIVGVKGHMTDEFFKHKENIYFINSINEEIIADEVEKIISDKPLLKDLRKGSKLTYTNYLSWEVISNKYISVLNN